MLDPEEAIDRLAAATKAPPGHRALHAKGLFFSGTFNATPDAHGDLQRGPPLGGDRPHPGALVPRQRPARLQRRDPFVRGMAVSFVLPDGSSTDILGQTAPRFPVRTPEDFIRLAEVSRDKKALRGLPRHPTPHGPGARRQRARQGAGATAQLRRGDLLPGPRLPLGLDRPAPAPGCATACSRRRRRRSDPPRQVLGARPPQRGDPGRGLALAPVRFKLMVTVGGSKDDPTQPDGGLEGQPRVQRRLAEVTTPEADAEAEGDTVVFDPTRVVPASSSPTTRSCATARRRTPCRSPAAPASTAGSPRDPREPAGAEPRPCGSLTHRP